MERLSITISEEAREILDRVAASLVHNERDRLPLGRVVAAMTLWFEENNEWDDITEAIRDDYADEAQRRRERDRERKRR
jgi:hypothetical protein